MTLDSLLNGMKSLFSSLGAKTSDSNYGVALLDKTSGEPKGLMGMSDLASVLGGIQIMNVMESGTISEIDKTCVYIIANSTYTPSDITPDFANSIVLTIKASGSQNPTLQVIISANGQNIRIRTRWYGDWNGWRTLTLS